MSDFDDGGYVKSSQIRETTAKKCLRSLTIKYLNTIDFEAAPYKLNGSELSSIQLVGFVTESKTTNAGFAFQLTDLTGMIECNFWPNSSFEEEQSGYIAVNNLLRIIGSVRVNNNMIKITVISLKLTDDPNFFLYNYINCMLQSLHYTGRLNKTEKEVIHKTSALTKIQSDILEVYKQNYDASGLHLDVVCRILSSKYSEDEIKENIDTLMNNFHLIVVSGLEYNIVTT